MKEKTERNEEIVRRHLDGEYLSEIGDDFGISRERVRQIVRASGVSPRQSRESRRVWWTCDECGLRELRVPSQAERTYCSPKCAGLARRDTDGIRSDNVRTDSEGCPAVYDRLIGRTIRLGRSIANERFRERYGRNLKANEWVGYVDRDPTNVALENLVVRNAGDALKARRFGGAP